MVCFQFIASLGCVPILAPHDPSWVIADVVGKQNRSIVGNRIADVREK